MLIPILAAILSVSAPLSADMTPEQINTVAVEFHAPMWLVTPERVTVRSAGFVRLSGPGIGARVMPGEVVEACLIWNGTRSAGRVSIADSDEEIEIEPLGIVAASVADSTPAPAISCTVACGSGRYACCRYGTGSPAYPVCLCFANDGPAQTCAAGGPGAVSCSLTQGGNGSPAPSPKIAPVGEQP